MYTICTICWDSLSSIPHESLYGGRVGTVSCGHVFHVNCINKWWNQQSRNHDRLMRQRQPGQPIPTLFYRCPVCRRGDQHPHVFELFFQDVEVGLEAIFVAAAGPKIPEEIRQQDHGEVQGIVVAPNGVRLERNEPQQEG